MQRLSHTLQSVLPDVTSLGGDSSAVDRDKLRHILQALAGDLSRTLALRAVLALLLVGLLALSAWQFASQPHLIVGTSLGAAVVALGAAAALRQVTDELARVRMLLAIAPDLTRESLTEVTRWMASAG